jgi:ABC-type glycerol-3-phosphate transport system substrate-binding protein
MKATHVLALTLAGAMASATLFTGCGASSASSSSATSDSTAQSTAETTDSTAASASGTTIKWISQGPGDSAWEGQTKPILEEFEKETGIHVDAEFYSFDDLFDVIETKSAAKSADFDVMSVDVTYVAKYGSSGYLEPLDSYFSADDKAKWDKASYTAGVWDNTMYAAPENTSTQELYYNKTLLDEAGITLPDNGADNRLTYEQVADLAKQAQQKLDPDGSKGLIGLDFQQVSRIYQMNMLPNSMGGKNISDDGYSLDGVVNTDAWTNAMTWYQNLVNDGVASKGYTADEIPEQFYSGNMVFMIGGTWTNALMTCDDEIGSTYAPCFKGYEDKVATSTGSWYFGMNSQSKNKDAAAEFIRFFTLGKGSDMWLEINKDVPSRLDKQQEIVDDPSSTEAMKIAAYEAANTAFPRAVTPAFGEYSTILNQAWEDVRNGADVTETLNDAVDKFNSAVASYKK